MLAWKVFHAGDLAIPKLADEAPFLLTLRRIPFRPAVAGQSNLHYNERGQPPVRRC
jgi:hypothetical protein